MSEKRILAIKDREGLCWNCLKDKSHIHKIYFGELGYGSGFDMFETELHLCDDCYNEHPEYWTLNIKKLEECEWWEEYEHEDEIFDYVSKMPIEGQQFFFNEFDTGSDARPMKPQDWIDYQLKILPHEKCKDYGLYSWEEINAYNERFPICEHPVNKCYSDGSCGCWCPFGAYGEKDQIAGLNISAECYQCKYFKKRETPLKTMTNKEYDKYEIEVKYNLIHK